MPIAVQEERQRNKEKSENEVESTSNSQNEMPIERICEAELKVEHNTENDNSQVIYGKIYANYDIYIFCGLN